MFNPLYLWPNKPSYEVQLGKYGSCGFTVIVPGMERTFFDYDCIHLTELSELKGLANLFESFF